EHREHAVDARVEVHRAGVPARLAVHDPLDGDRHEVDRAGPVLPGLDGPRRRVGQRWLGAGLVAELPAQLPTDPRVYGRADRGGLLLPILGRLRPGSRFDYPIYE